MAILPKNRQFLTAIILTSKVTNFGNLQINETQNFSMKLKILSLSVTQNI